ncbi:carbohydrate ABC transporter permease [Paenibacillus sp. LjRoot153]|uniref:carbohydrate ABC transporter permease n=1 Tax=Paenibacillus sp. LjRoot153 TaxID=3342270 RepID=UPI003ECCBDCE
MSIKRWDSALLIRIILFMLAALTLYPVLFTVFTSLKTSDEFYSNLWSIPSQFHYENYVEAFQTARLGDYMGNSIMIAVLSLFTCSVLATFAAYSLARLRVPFAGAIVGVLFLLQILPGESMIIPLYMMMTKLAIFKVIYLPIVIAYLGWMLPGTIVILWNFFRSIPDELLEAARIDGSSEMNTMFRIVFPLAGGAVATCTVFNFGFVWGELMWAQIATLTTERGVPISVGLINFQGQYTTNWTLMSAGMCMVLLPLILLFIILQKYFVQGLTSGGVKG